MLASAVSASSASGLIARATVQITGGTFTGGANGESSATDDHLSVPIDAATGRVVLDGTTLSNIFAVYDGASEKLTSRIACHSREAERNVMPRLLTFSSASVAGVMPQPQCVATSSSPRSGDSAAPWSPPLADRPVRLPQLLAANHDLGYFRRQAELYSAK